MKDWRDDLDSVLNMDIDPETGFLRSNDQALTNEYGVTDYGRIYFTQRLSMLSQIIPRAADEICIFEALNAEERESAKDRAELKKLLEIARRDYQAVIDYRESFERYLTSRIGTDEDVPSR